MSTNTEICFDDNVITQISDTLAEPKWMVSSRLAAFNQLVHLPLPRVEKTNIENWNFSRFKPYQEEAVIDSIACISEDARASLVAPYNVLVQKNSSTVYHQVEKRLTDQGVIFTDLHTAMKKHEKLVQTYYMTKGIKSDEHRLAALHAALTSGGVFLYVPRNQEVTVPLQALFTLSGEETAIFPHILIVAEENSRVDFSAQCIGEEGAALNNSMFEVFVGENARVRIFTVNHLKSSTVDVTYRRSMVDRLGQLEWITSELSEGRCISNNTVHLLGEGATSNLKTIALGTGGLRSNITSEIHHFGKHTDSDIHVRSVMKDSASNILNSITKIEKGATKSDGQQSSKVLMLNEKARGDANPILLIDENDVSAGHAASVGRVDPLQIYYLMSRGVSKQDAEKLIIDGFLDAVISQIPITSMQQSIHRVIGRKYHHESLS